MKNKLEIYTALAAKETLVASNGDKCKIVEGNLFATETDLFVDWSFMQPANWQIYEEPKWYENIPESGVLCWVSNSDKGIHSTNKTIVAIINDYQINSPYKYNFISVISTRHLEAEPLTKQEIQIFMAHAPKDKDNK